MHASTFYFTAQSIRARLITERRIIEDLVVTISHVHQALEQVRDIRRRILDRQLFQGYSGLARISGGILALLGAMVMSREVYPTSPRAHVVGWGIVAAISFSINVAALARWYLGRDRNERKLEDLRPVIDAICPLVVGAILTWGILRIGAYDLLFGVWMCIFALVNIASHYTLPRANWHIGWFYIVAGAWYFYLWPETSFVNPWPMGLVFCFGETIGGIVFTRSCLERSRM